MMTKSLYRQINLVFLVLTVLVVLYAALWPPQGGHPLPSFYTLLTGRPSPTAGLSRSFSAMVRGEVMLARELSPYGPALFLFFFLQMVWRLVVLFLLRRPHVAVSRLVRWDLLFSLFLFLVAYFPLFVLLGRML